MFTGHGIPRIWQANGAVKKRLWFIITVASTAGLITALTLLSNKFFARKLTVDLSYVNERSLPFPACSGSWEDVDGKCYQIIDKGSDFSNFQEARQKCWDVGGELGVPNTANLWNYVKDEDKHVVVGITDAHREGDYISYTGEAISAFLQPKRIFDHYLNDDYCCKDPDIQHVFCEKDDASWNKLSANYLQDVCLDSGLYSCANDDCTDPPDGSTAPCQDGINGYTCADLPNTYNPYGAPTTSPPPPVTTTLPTTETPTTAALPTTTTPQTTTQATTTIPPVTTTTPQTTTAQETTKLPTTETPTTAAPPTTTTPQTTTMPETTTLQTTQATTTTPQVTSGASPTTTATPAATVIEMSTAVTTATETTTYHPTTMPNTLSPTSANTPTTAITTHSGAAITSQSAGVTSTTTKTSREKVSTIESSTAVKFTPETILSSTTDADITFTVQPATASTSIPNKATKKAATNPTTASSRTTTASHTAGGLRSAFAKQNQIYSSISDLAVEDRMSLGFQRDEFLIDCQINGHECSKDAFVPFHNPIHGNCYTFNAGNTNFSMEKEFLSAGRRNGLHLIANIMQEEYTLDMGESAGARIVVHPSRTLPFPEDEGYLALPGTLTSLAIKLTTKHMPPFPYSNCTQFGDHNEARNVFQEIYNVNYTEMGCMKTCYQTWVIKQCSCADPFYPRYGKALKTKENILFSCKYSAESEKCMENIKQKYNKNKLVCECPPTCKKDKYKVQVSKAQWPADYAMQSTLRRLTQKGSITSETNAREFLQNFLKVEVFYEDFIVRKCKEIPHYGQDEYSSDFGGTAGLFLGFSVITVMEIVEKIGDLMYEHGWLRFKRLLSRN